jgi:uncharacterized protein (DUF302 family)
VEGGIIEPCIRLLAAAAAALTEKGPQMSTPVESGNGLVRIACNGSATDVAARLEAALRDRGIAVFARIDFSSDARKAGLTMHTEVLLIFGNPKAGTPLMIAAPGVGIDLPLKALVWEDDESRAWLAYNDPHYIIRRHGLDAALAGNLTALIPLIEGAARG